MTRGGYRKGADYVNDSYGMDSQGYFGNDMSRRGRKENGLVELTKKFIHLLKTADEQTLDLNDAVKDLLV